MQLPQIICPLRLKPSVVANSKFKTEWPNITNDTNTYHFLYLIMHNTMLNALAHEQQTAREKTTDLDKRQARMKTHKTAALEERRT